jgi:hypothetical protein
MRVPIPRTAPSLRKLPAVSTYCTLAKGRHGLISTSSLSLGVADFPILASTAFQRTRDTSFSMGHHCFAHILCLKSLVFGSSFGRLEFVVGHCHESLWSKVASEDLLPQAWIGLCPQVLVQRSELGLVFFRVEAVLGPAGSFDVAGIFDDCEWGFVGEGQLVVTHEDDVVRHTVRRIRGQSIIYQTNRSIPLFIFCSFDVDSILFP